MYNINKSWCFFIVGLFIGCYLALYLKTESALTRLRKPVEYIELPKPLTLINNYYDCWFKGKGYTRKKLAIDKLRYENISHRSEAVVLKQNIPILCVILSVNDKTANAGINTWAKGCNRVKVVHLGIRSDKLKFRRKNALDFNWSKLCTLLRNINYEEYFWAVFVHQQTFVLTENLRWFVASLNYSKGYYLGHAESFWNVQYNLAQAGFVLSQGSLKILKRFLLENRCNVDNLMINKEDFTLGRILATFGILPMDTRDSDGYSTFHAFNWQQEFFPGANYYGNAIYPRKCCSSRTITFKGIEQDKFYMYQYLLYHLDVFHDGSLGNKRMPAPKDKNHVWKQFLSEHGVYRNVTAEEYFKIWEKYGVKPEMFNQFENYYD